MLLPAAAVLTYLPFLSLPLMPDDYLQVQLAERYGTPSGWCDLAADPLYRCRATSLLVTAVTMQWAGWSVVAFNGSSILLHALNVLLIAALGSCRWIGYRVSVPAAFVFAIAERHHEAIIWYASIHEPLVLLFMLLSILALIRWLEGGSRVWIVAGALGAALALASKESAVVLALLAPALVSLYPEHRKRVLPLLLSALLLAGLYFLAAFVRRSEHQHFNDGTFALGTQVFRTMLAGIGRGLWVWGVAGLAAAALCRQAVNRKVVALGVLWFVTGLLPYAFLTYMPRIPSRHYYVASVGVALIVAAGSLVFIERRRPKTWLAVLLACTFVAHNWTYLWTHKKPQFLWRASLTEDLVSLAETAPDQPIVNACPELRSDEARRAIYYRLGRDAEAASGGPTIEPLVYTCDSLARD